MCVFLIQKFPIPIRENLTCVIEFVEDMFYFIYIDHLFIAKASVQCVVYMIFQVSELIIKD